MVRLGWLDGLPPVLRDLLQLLVTTAVMWAGESLVPWLEGRGGYAAIAATVLVLVLKAVTTATREYGVGSAPRGEVRR